MEDIFESDGLFWWGKDKVPKGYIAPPSAVAGKLKIQSSGAATLQLIGLLNSITEACDNLFKSGQALEEDATIHGVFSNGKGTVILGRLRNNGVTIGGGLSTEGFIAEDCLLHTGDNRPPSTLCFKSFTVELTSLDEWFNISGIEVKRQRAGYSLKVKMPPPSIFDLNGTKLSIAFLESPAARGVFSRSVRQANIKQSIFLSLNYPKAQSLEAHRDSFRLIEDLFLLLTGHRIYLTWPVLKAGGVKCTYYFRRDVDTTPPLKWADCWTLWGSVQNSFGELYSSLKINRDLLGPGLYLYIGTRRMSKFYIENQFMNLIWGLESLHRKKPELTELDPNGLQKKIDRILEQVSVPKDKNWLANRLKNAGEPNLSKRLFELFSELPIDIDQSNMRKFCDECAHRRNDISHFGGNRHDSSYSDFIAQLRLITGLVIDFYHALLLLRIGLDKEIIRNYFYNGPKSHGYKKQFEALKLNNQNHLED